MVPKVVENPQEAVETLLAEMCLSENAAIPRFQIFMHRCNSSRRISWESYMTSFLRRHAERTANMYILNCSTPAQYFHALRRQVKGSSASSENHY